MMSFNAGIGLAGSLAKGMKSYTNREEIQAKSAEFKLRKTKADVSNNEDAMKAQLDALTAQNKAIIGKQAKSETYQALDLYYSSDGNNKSLNKVLQDNPVVRNAWKGISSIQNIDPATDQKLLNERGIKPEDFNSFRYVKGIMPDGKEQLIDMWNMSLGTGYAQYKDEQSLDMMVKRNKLTEETKKPNMSPIEKKSKYLASQGVEGGSEAKVAGSLYNEEVAGNTPGQLQIADQTVDKLFTTFGDEDGFFSTDFSNSKNRVKAMSMIHGLERYYKINIPAAERADIHDLSALTSLAGLAAEKVTEEVTGAFDSMYQTAKNYVSSSVDTIDAVEGRAAYAQFRNTTRHALFGSALTASEVQSFNEAFGTIRQKYPAVVASFKTALTQTRDKFQSIYDMNNPILMKYYVNKSPEDISKIIRGLDQRLDLLRTEQGIPTKAEQQELTLRGKSVPGKPKSLGELFGEPK